MIELCGHSLGAARALIAAGMLVDDGTPPDLVVTCGSPAPGTRTLGSLLASVTQRAYRNAGDDVWIVPTQPPFWHPTAAIGVNQPGTDGTLFANHHITLYQAGVPAADKPYVDLMAASYHPQPADFDVIQTTAGVYWCLKRVGPSGRPCVTFRGSDDAEDWARDFVAVPFIEPDYWKLGMLHAGFAMGMAAALKAIVAAL